MKRTPLKRSPMRRKPSRSKAEFTPEVRTEIARRSQGVCEAGVPEVCRMRAVLMHHKRRRKAGDGTADNGMHLCESCHNWIHSNVAKSNELGWLIRSN